MKSVNETIAALVAANLIVSRKVTYWSDVKPSAKCKQHTLRKLVIGRFTIGQEYKPESVDGNSEGSDDSRSLPWGEWESYPYVIRHNGSEYLRLTPQEGDKPHVEFWVDGNEVTREQFAEYLTPANARKLFESRKPECINVKMTNVQSVL